MNNMSYISCLVFAVLVFWIGFALKRCPSALRILRRDVLAVLLVFAVAASLVADKTNGLMRIIGQLRSPAPVAVTVSSEDIARGWRIESISTHETMSYEMPTNAAYVGNWHVHGARSSFGRNVVEFGAMRSRGTRDPTIAEWAFPLGTNFESFTSFWYFVDGRIRPTPRDAAREIRAAGGPMFAAPGLSRLWTAEESDGGQSLTWENFFLGNDTNTPINAQIRLYENGDFTTSSNELVTVCRRVEPFDWDGDGISNSIDPDPYTGIADCHGTCAAWYNIACSNILTAVDGDCGVDLTWRDGVNQNAYYFVEVVAESGPAQIVFSASQAGNLGSPVIVVHAGETNTVPLLVGVEYAVTSTVPISVSAPSDGYAQVAFDTPRSCRIHWPISFAFSEAIGEAAQSGNVPRTYDVTVEPYDPGGLFSWDVPSGCHCITYIGSHPVYSCTAECTCGGNCLVSGWFLFEGIMLPVAGGECRCGFTDTERPAMPQGEGPCVSVSFSDSAVIYEDSYQESPGVWKLKRSMRTWLTVYANGGPNGGMLTLSSQNIDKLSVVEGESFALPSTLNLASDETYSAQYLFEGELPSASLNDIQVSGSMLPNGATDAIQSSATLTSVKVELEAVYTAPENPCASRHTYGVGEKVTFRTVPQGSAITVSIRSYNALEEHVTYYNSFDGSSTAEMSTERQYTCPVSSFYVPYITVACAGSGYTPVMHTIDPAEVVTREASWPGGCWPSGSVGEATLRTVNYIGPMHVSFQGIAVSEVPCNDVIPATGCFTQGVHALSHTYEAQAGWAYRIKPGNYWCIDNAESTVPETNWMQGVASEMTWKIPIGWHRIEPWAVHLDYWRLSNPDMTEYGNTNSLPLLIGGRNDMYLQERHIDVNGVFRTDKFGHWISRSRWCHIILDGRTVQWFH